MCGLTGFFLVWMWMDGQGYRLPRPAQCPADLYDPLTFSVPFCFSLRWVGLSWFLRPWCGSHYVPWTHRYDVVLRCWQRQPEERPKFKSLLFILSEMSEDESSL